MTDDHHSTDHSIWTAIFSDDPQGLRSWLASIGFEEGILVPGQGRGVMHSEMIWPEGGRVMVSSPPGDDGVHASGRGLNLYVVTGHPDAVHDRVVATGATVTRPLEDATDYESRGFSCVDPDGNHWSFGTYAGE